MAPRDNSGPSRLQAQALIELGGTYYNLRNYPRAIEYFDQALQTDPTFTRALVAKAHAFRMLGKPEESLRICDEVLARLPVYANAHSTRGAALRALGRIAEAHDAYERAVALAPQDALVYYNFACFWALQNDPEKCREYLSHAMELDPGRNIRAAVDPDFARYREECWFQQLTAFK